MDGILAIEHNLAALKRILAGLFAMVGLVAGGSEGASTANSAKTLPRHIRNAVLRLLRPAEAAARRLIIALARELVVKLSPRKPSQEAPVFKDRVKIGLHIGVRSRFVWKPGSSFPNITPMPPAPPPRLSLPLFDALPRPFKPRRKYVPDHLAPRIRSLGGFTRCLPSRSEGRRRQRRRRTIRSMPCGSACGWKRWRGCWTTCETGQTLRPLARPVRCP